MPESAALHYKATRVPVGPVSRLQRAFEKLESVPSVGDRSSMVELQIVILAVAGSSPVGHPPCSPRRNGGMTGAKTEFRA
jgi:hypothetical protein